MTQEACTLHRRQFMGTLGTLCVGIALESAIDKRKLAAAEPATIIAWGLLSIVYIAMAVLVGYGVYQIIHDSEEPLSGQNGLKNRTAEQKTGSFCLSVFRLETRFLFIKSRRLVHSAEQQFTIQPYGELLFDWSLDHALPPGSYELITDIEGNQAKAKILVARSGCGVRTGNSS